MSNIKFPATVYKVQTLADMGLRLTLDLPEDAVMQAAELMECKRAGVVLAITCEPLAEQENLTGLDDDAKQADERSEKRTSKVGRIRS